MGAKNRIKKYVFYLAAFLVVVIFVLPQVCVAAGLGLEQTYPSVPGAPDLNQVVGEQGGQQMSHLFQYYLRLTLYIAIGICVLVLIVSGFMYLTTRSFKPGLVSRSRAMAQNGFWGLAIVLSAFLILYIINPQLLLFNVELVKPGSLTYGLGGEEAEKRVLLYKINSLEEAKKVIDSVGDTIYKGIDYDGTYNPLNPTAPMTFQPNNSRFLAWLFPKAQATDPNTPAKEIYRAELPLRQTELIMRKIIESIGGKKDDKGNIVEPGLTTLLEDCRCGEGIFHINWGHEKANFYGECIGGMSEEDEKSFWNTILKDNNGVLIKDIDGKEQKKYSKADSQDVCQTECKDCGLKNTLANSSQKVCDLREVKMEIAQISVPEITPEGVLNVVRIAEVWLAEPDLADNAMGPFQFCDKKNWGYFKIAPVGWELPPAWATKWWSPDKIERVDVEQSPFFYYPLSKCDPEGEKVRPERFIKAKRLELDKLLAELEAQKPKFVVEQVGPISDVLLNNAASYLLTNSDLEASFFDADFDDFSKSLPEGLQAEVQVPKQFSSTLEGRLSPVVAQKPQGFWEKMSQLFFGSAQAQAKFRYEAGNFYIAVQGDVFPQKALDRNNFAFREASRASLFSVLTDLSLEKIQALFSQCLTAAFGEAGYNITPEQISAVLQQAISSGSADRLIAALIENIPALADLTTEIIAGEYGKGIEDKLKVGCKQEAAGDQNKYDQCIKDNLPPNFISQTIAKTLNKPIEDLLSKDCPIGASAKDCKNLKTYLNQELRQFFGEDLNTSLDTEMGAFYDRILQGALTKTLGEVGGLNQLLEKKLIETPYLDVVLGHIQEVDGFLAQKVQEWKKKISNYTENLVTGLVKKYTSDKVSNVVQNFKESHPQYFPENYCPADCFQRLRDGYIYRWKNGVPESNDLDICDGECVLLTPEEINGDDLKTVYTGKRFGNAVQDFRYLKKDVCEGAGYCWGRDWEASTIYERAQGSEECRECQWVGQGGQGGLQGKASRLKNQTVAGLVNFAEQFVAALVETTMHAVLQYAKVFIQDEITAPFAMYINQVGDLHKNLQKFLTASFKDVLPQEVAGLLDKNLQGLLADFCESYEDQYNKNVSEGRTEEKAMIFEFKSNDHKIDWIKVKTVENGNVNYESFTITPKTVVTPTSPFSAAGFVRFSNKLCKLEKHLNTTLLEEVAASSNQAQKVVDVLNTSIKEQLKQVCFGEKPNEICLGDYLALTPAEIIFLQTPLKNINDLIKATPKDIVCGDTQVKWQPESDPEKKTVEVLSGGVSAQLGCLGSLQGQVANPSAPVARDLVKGIPLPNVSSGGEWGFCHFQQAVCQNPQNAFLIAQLQVGPVVKLLLDESCNWLSKRAQDEMRCVGACVGSSLTTNPVRDALPADICPDNFKTGCQACSVATKDTMALSLFRLIMLLDFGPKAAPLGDESRVRELSAYKWLYLGLGEPMREELRKAALIRGITLTEWESVKNSAASSLAGRLDSSLVGRTQKDLLLAVPFGIVKSFDGKGATLTGKEENQNFLSRSAPELLLGDVCDIVIESFETNTQTKAWSFDEMYYKQQADIRPSLSYTLQSLQKVTLSTVVDAILHQSSLDPGIAYPYVFCKVQNYSPSQILGLDQPLMDFVRPKEMQIMFQIIEDFLNQPGDKPQALTDFIRFLNSTSLTQGLTDLSQQIASNIGPEPQPQKRFGALLNYTEKMSLIFVDQAIFANLPQHIKDGFTAQNIIIPPKTPWQYPLLTSDSNRPTVFVDCGLELGRIGADYYFCLKPNDPNSKAADWLINVYYLPTQSNQKINAIASFLNTPLNQQIRQTMDNRRLIDMICQDPSLQTTNPDGSKTSECDQAIFNTDGFLALGRLTDFLLKTPAEALQNIKWSLYSGKDLPSEICVPKTAQACPKGTSLKNNQCCRAGSVIDFLALKNSWLDMPVIDLLGKQLGLDKALYDTAQGLEKARSALDSGAGKMAGFVENVGNQVNQSLIEKPVVLAGQAVDYLTGKIAQLFGYEVGKSTADQIAGACTAKPEGGVCPNNTVERTLAGKKECCGLGAPLVCEPKCRPRPDEGCQEYRGETEANRQCCFNISFDKSKPTGCAECRLKRADQGGKCREPEETEQMVGKDNTVVCCRDRVLVKEQFCCTSVVDCVNGKFAENLDAMADNFAIGTMPLDTLIDEK